MKKTTKELIDFIHNHNQPCNYLKCMCACNFIFLISFLVHFIDTEI